MVNRGACRLPARWRTCSTRSGSIPGPWWWNTIAASCAGHSWRRRRSTTGTWWRWCTLSGEDDAMIVDTPFELGGREFRSRLMVGTGKYRTNAEMTAALEASGAEIVTVAVRRVDLDRANEEGILHHLSPDQYFLLANTAGCYTADEAVRYARLAREAGFNEFVKLEVIGDKATLLPDTEGLLEATRTLAAEGFKV